MRPDYASLPLDLRDAVDRLLGWEVRATTTCDGGWSPGVAALVEGSGGRAFVKAGSAEVNALTAQMHRREAALTPLLPPHLGGAQLIGTIDREPWFVLVLTAVDGRPPVQPWVDAELDAALSLLSRLAAVPGPEALTRAEEQLEDDVDRWPLLVDDPRLPEWELRHAGRLVSLERDWRQAVEGDRLLHLDVRADNLLVRPDGSAVLVDWPSAAVGHPVVDLMGLAPSVAVSGGPSVVELLARAGQPQDDRTRVVAAAFAGLFRWRSLQPAPPGMPAVRAFQAAQADALAPALACLTGWS